MKEPRLATFTVEVPITFKFTARSNTDSDVLLKQAEETVAIVLNDSKYIVDFDEKRIKIIKTEIHYTPEEKKLKEFTDKMDLREYLDYVSKGGKIVYE